MKMKDEDIFDVLDSIASEETIRLHKKMLAESADYQVLYQEYAHTHALLMDVSTEKTAFNFTDKLIDRWEVSQEIVMVHKSYKLPLYFLAIMSVLVFLLLLTVLPMANNATMNVDLSVLINFFQNKLIIRSILLINALMMFYFLDKRFLKPYFQKRFGV